MAKMQPSCRASCPGSYMAQPSLRFSTSAAVAGAHLHYESKPVLVTTKEHTVSTTTDTNMEGGIFTIDQAAAYLSIPKATLYTWRTRRAGFGP
ncbi:hypothetical protein JCM10369A_44770 [Nocardioides pyridinolyticus]